MTNINWTNISSAIEFYKTFGFEYIETPWFVNTTTAEITCPDKRDIVELNNCGRYSTLKGLVGSAEQGFLQLALDKKLDLVNYVSVGPCFRVEKEDEYHLPQFMKVELFSLCNTEEIAKSASKQMLLTARKFMGLDRCDKIETDSGHDLLIGGIEVGSYGHRYHESVGWWAYGTGLAEPRYSQAITHIS